MVVRYCSFADFRLIVESEPYAPFAKPHHCAAIMNWRITAMTVSTGVAPVENLL